MNKYHQEVYTPVITSRQYLHTTQAGATLPFLQASITGAILGSLALILAFIWRARDPWLWGGLAAVLAWAFTWVILQRHWFSLTNLETLTGLDLDGNGEIGKPAEVRIRLQDVTQAGHYHESIYPLPATLPQMQELAQGLADGLPFSERNWTGSGRPFSVNEFRVLRSEMIKRGLLAVASSKDPRQGYTLTAAGRAIMQNFPPALSQESQ